jgi:hypothetical protein
VTVLVVSPDGLPEHHRAAVASLPLHYRLASAGEPCDVRVAGDLVHYGSQQVAVSVAHDPGWRAFVAAVADLDLVLVRLLAADDATLADLSAHAPAAEVVTTALAPGVSVAEAVAVDALVRVTLPPPTLFGRSGTVVRLDAAGTHSPAPVYENRYRVAWRELASG